MFLVLLCNDRAVLGPWVNKLWLNIVCAIIVGVLITLSVILAVTTLLPLTNTQTLQLAAASGIVLMISLLIVGGVTLVKHCRKGSDAELAALYAVDKNTWRMPPLAELTKPVWSRTLTIGMFALRIYLVVAVALLVYKFIVLAFVH